MLDKINIYLNLDERDFEDESQYSIIGYYDVVVPLKNKTTGVIENDYDIIKQVRSTLKKDTEEIKVDEINVIFNCYKGQGDYAEDLQEVYRWKDEIEDKVREEMRMANVLEYDLIIHVTTFTYMY